MPKPTSLKNLLEIWAIKYKTNEAAEQKFLNETPPLDAGACIEAGFYRGRIATIGECLQDLIDLVDHLQKQGRDGSGDQRSIPKENAATTGKIVPLPKLSLDCHNMDIRTALQMISESWGVKIAVTGNVRGTITMTMGNTPADELLGEILFKNDLVGFQEKDSVVVRPRA